MNKNDHPHDGSVLARRAEGEGSVPKSKRLTRAKLIRWAKAHGACKEGLAAFARTNGEPIAVLKRWARRAATGRVWLHFEWVLFTARSVSSHLGGSERYALNLWWRRVNGMERVGPDPDAWDVLERVILADLARIEESRRG